MIFMRRWSVRHARGLEVFYKVFENIFVALDPLWRLIGYERLDAPVAAVERVVKGFFFDCQMCGQCALSSTGMSCPMNCPKNLRNGPCGGVRANGHCEVRPDMPCVWVLGFEGSRRMRSGATAIRLVQLPVDRRMQGRSAWLAVARERASGSEQASEAR
jgi:Methylene-tetrahydrofolate reductase C terminal